MSQHYNEDYKQAAVAKTKASGNVSQTACELGISNKSLHARRHFFTEIISR
jgi:hypothetical protein